MEFLENSSIVQYWGNGGNSLGIPTCSPEAANQMTIVLDQVGRVRENRLVCNQLAYLSHVASGGALKIGRDDRSDLTRLPLAELLSGGVQRRDELLLSLHNRNVVELYTSK